MPDFTSPPSVPPTNQKHKALGIFATGCVMLVAIAAMRTGLPSSEPLRQVPKIDFTLIPLVTGEEPIQEVFVRSGCPVCHQIPGIPGANGQVGPPLWLGTTGTMRLADPQYHGQAESVRDYIVESIVSPGSYVVPGFPADTMPTWYGRKLTATALRKMVTYLESATDLKAPEIR